MQRSTFQPIATYRRELLTPLKKAPVSWEARDESEKRKRQTWGRMLLQSAAMVAKKLLVDKNK